MPLGRPVTVASFARGRRVALPSSPLQRSPCVTWRRVSAWAGASTSYAAGIMARVLVACEFSGVVRDAFRARGHDAISCDLLETETPGPHIRGDVTFLLGRRWDLVIAHPPCTRLCNSGVRWLYERNLWDEMHKAARFFLECLNANAPRVAVENPVMHKHARAAVGRGHNFTVQPWQFGHPETKRTCFWTRNLPPLEPTSIVDGRDARVHREAPGPDRWKKPFAYLSRHRGSNGGPMGRVAMSRVRKWRNGGHVRPRALVQGKSAPLLANGRTSRLATGRGKRGRHLVVPIPGWFFRKYQVVYLLYG